MEADSVRIDQQTYPTNIFNFIAANTARKKNTNHRITFHFHFRDGESKQILFILSLNLVDSMILR